jgi:hypothetical protein
MNYRRLIGGLSFLLLLRGALLLCFIPGGFLNPYHYYGGGGIRLEENGHIAGFICAGLGAVGFVILFSLEKKR